MVFRYKLLSFAHRTTLVLVANKSDNPNDSDKTNNSDKTNSSDKTNIPTIPNSNPTVDVNPKATITLYKLETPNTNSESIGYMRQALNQTT